MFHDVVRSGTELRELYREPAAGALRKQIDTLDAHCRSFIGRSTLVLVATVDGAGRADVSPKGGPPGFVCVLDDRRLALPDLTGNNRLDSITNVLDHPGIGLLFVIPGLDETLRVNGRAALVRDADVLDACTVRGRRPKLALGVEVDEVYLHCAKAFKRGGVWDQASWPDRTGMASVACMLRDHMGDDGLEVEQIQAALDDGYANRLW